MEMLNSNDYEITPQNTTMGGKYNITMYNIHYLLPNLFVFLMIYVPTNVLSSQGLPSQVCRTRIHPDIVQLTFTNKHESSDFQ